MEFLEREQCIGGLGLECAMTTERFEPALELFELRGVSVVGGTGRSGLAEKIGDDMFLRIPAGKAV